MLRSLGGSMACASRTCHASRQATALWPAARRRAAQVARAAQPLTRAELHAGTQNVDDMPKNFEHSAVEERLYAWWEAGGYFQPQGVGEPYSIAMPPPNVTGALHMGHAMFVTLQDVMARWARMNGKRVLWLPGTRAAAPPSGQLSSP